MAKDSIYDKARRLNEMIDKLGKSVIVRRGKIVAFSDNESRDYIKFTLFPKKKKRRKKK